MPEISPVELEKTDDRELVIRWSDESVQRLKFRSIRKACPCANCLEKRKSEANQPKGMLKVLSPAEAAPLDIVQMRPVGNYAYNIQFSDGHSSGIFSFDLLRSIE